MGRKRVADLDAELHQDRQRTKAAFKRVSSDMAYVRAEQAKLRDVVAALDESLGPADSAHVARLARDRAALLQEVKFLRERLEKVTRVVRRLAGRQPRVVIPHGPNRWLVWRQRDRAWFALSGKRGDRDRLLAYFIQPPEPGQKVPGYTLVVDPEIIDPGERTACMFDSLREAQAEAESIEGMIQETEGIP